MILTITLNPAVDISYKLDLLAIDTVNRVEDVSKTAGGKGLNVARVLKQLGQDVAASGFLGGSLGSYIRSQVNITGIHDYFIDIDEDTRNCIAVIHEGKQTEILENGPTISGDETALFLEKFVEYVQKVKIVTISGSLPKGLPTDFYVKLLEIADKYNTSVLLDTNGVLLISAITSPYKPYLIKPNEEEFADLLGVKSISETQIIEALATPRFSDIPWIVVTRGAEGAIIKHAHTLYRAKAPKIEVVNPVGSGDSVIAGFSSGFYRDLGVKETIKYGLAMGVLNALEEKTGHIDISKVEWAVEQIKVDKI